MIRAPLTHGYPAATGIGTDAGGVIIDFIALSESEQVQVLPIRNPGQVDAHSLFKGGADGGCARKMYSEVRKGEGSLF